MVRVFRWPDRRRSRLRHLALRPDREPTGYSTVMKISPAPNNYPSGTRPVAVGAGVQFATDPCRASWDEGYTGLGSGLTQNGNGTSPERVGGIRSMGVPSGAKTGDGSNTAAPKRAAETIRATRMREGSISPALPPISAGPGRSRGYRDEGWGLLIPIRL